MITPAPTSRGDLLVLPLAAVLACMLAAASLAGAQGADVAAIQAREARNADVRTIAALERFRQALIARYSSDPALTKLQISEAEGTALVQRSPFAPPEVVIFRGDRWMGTENRELKPWASASVATANAFALSSVRAASIRAWLDAWRATPGQATDFVTDYEIGYDPAAARVFVRARVGSMTTGKLALHAFDPATGRAISVAAPSPR